VFQNCSPVVVPISSARSRSGPASDRSFWRRARALVPGAIAAGLVRRQQVLDDRPPRRGLPRRLHRHRPGHVPAVLRNVGAAGTGPELPPIPLRPKAAYSK
jgi:hypothetical protein